MIRLLDNREVDRRNIFFDAATHHFRLAATGEDITPLIRRADKLSFDGFDVEFDNDRLYRERYAEQHGGQQPPPVGSTSTLGNFADQILHDPLNAPLASLDSAVKQIFSSTGIKVIGALALAGVALYLFSKRP